MKAIRILRLGIAVMVLTGFISCSKEDLPEDPYFRCELNGVPYSLENLAIVKGQNPDGTYTITISASNAADLVRLYANSDQDFAAGQVFTTQQGGLFYNKDIPANNNDNKWMSVYNYATVPEMFSLQLTEVTSKYIRGAFVTDIYRDVNDRIEKIQVRNGEFLASYHP